MKKWILLLACIPALQVLSAQEALRKAHFNLEKAVALSGYDPVAYFTEGKAIRGSNRNALTHQGVMYYFSSPHNRDLFAGKPASYEPQYGGWCAYAMGAKGEKVPVDPDTFKIIKGKLYLFYNRFFNNTLKDWNKDEARLMEKADQSWKHIFR